MPVELIDHIASFLPFGEQHVSRMASVNSDTREALKERAFAEKLIAFIDTAPNGAGTVGYLAQLITDAEELSEALKIQLLDHLMKCMPDNLPNSGHGVANLCNALRVSVAKIVDTDIRQKATLAFAAVLGNARFQWVGNMPAGEGRVHAPMIALHDAFAIDCHQFAAAPGHGETLTPRMRAELFGALAGSMVSIGPAAPSVAQWSALAERDDCGIGDTRLPLLTGLAVALARLPAGAQRAAGFVSLVGKLPTLSPECRVPLMKELAMRLHFLGNDTVCTARYRDLRRAGNALPQPYRSEVLPALLRELESLPVEERKEEYDSAFAALPDCGPQQLVSLLSTLAGANKYLPDEDRVAALDALRAVIVPLDSARRAQAGEDWIDAVSDLPGVEMQEEITTYFVAAICLAHSCENAHREPLIRSLIDATGAIHDTGNHVAVCRDVLQLIEEQPQHERATNLKVMYHYLGDEFVSETIVELMTAYDAVATRLSAADQAMLIGDATDACMCLEDGLLPAQFAHIVARADALPQPYCADARQNVVHAVHRAIDSLDRLAPFRRADAFDELLHAASLLAIELRAALLRNLSQAIGSLTVETRGAAAANLWGEILHLPPEQHAPLLMVIQEAFQQQAG